MGARRTRPWDDDEVHQVAERVGERCGALVTQRVVQLTVGEPDPDPIQLVLSVAREEELEPHERDQGPGHGMRRSAAHDLRRELPGARAHAATSLS